MSVETIWYSLRNPLTIEDTYIVTTKIEETGNRICRILHAWGGYVWIPFPKNHPWNLSGEFCIGEGNYYNTNMSVAQLWIVLAACGHPIIPDLLRWKKWDKDSIQKIIDAQALEWLRILDIWCGLRPVFARLARALGATVYTLDKESSESFKTNENCDPKRRQEEKEHHIVLDLHHDTSAQIVYEWTNGNFDYITSAAIFQDGWITTKAWMKIVEKNIKKWGLFYSHALRESVEIFQ